MAKIPVPARTPLAHVGIELDGAIGGACVVRVRLELVETEGGLDPLTAVAQAREALACLRASEVEAYAAPPTRAGKVHSVHSQARLTERPEDHLLTEVRWALAAKGYRVTLEETRVCEHPGCAAKDTFAWKAGANPPGWHSSSICGKHQYRSCTNCGSAYVLTSTNAAGQAPSLHCEVCGGTLVEWGGSKVWEAELVSNGRIASS